MVVCELRTSIKLKVITASSGTRKILSGFCGQHTQVINEAYKDVAEWLGFEDPKQYLHALGLEGADILKRADRSYGRKADFMP